MDIGRALADRIEQHLVDEADHRCLIDRRIRGFILGLVRLQLETDIFQAFLFEVVEFRMGRLQRALDGAFQLVGSHQDRLDVKAGTEGDFVDQVVVGWIRHTHEQGVAAQVQRQGAMFLDEFFIDQRHRCVGDVEGGHVQQRDAVFLGREGGQHLEIQAILADQPGQHGAPFLGGLLVRFQGGLLVQQALGDQPPGESMQVAGDFQLSAHQRVTPCSRVYYTNRLPSDCNCQMIQGNFSARRGSRVGAAGAHRQWCEGTGAPAGHVSSIFIRSS